MTAEVRDGGGRPVPRMARIGRERHPLARSLQALERRDQLGATLERVHVRVEEGLDHDEFFLAYQPRFSLLTGEATGVEALLRWEGAAGTLMVPRSFLPAVKQTSAMIPLGRWVLGASCTQAARWEADRPDDADPVVMAVNVTALEVLERGFCDALLDAADAAGLPLELLQLELDATDQIGGDATLPLRIQALRRLGVRMAIDNVGPAFGMGIHRLAVDAVHIDRRWVRSTGTGDGELVEGLAGLVERAHASGAVVCAAGVQSECEVEILRAIGCDEAQGFHLCPPLTADELDWIDARG